MKVFRAILPSLVRDCLLFSFNLSLRILIDYLILIDISLYGHMYKIVSARKAPCKYFEMSTSITHFHEISVASIGEK